MRQINLLPPELAEKRRARRVTRLMMLGALGMVVLLVLVYTAQLARLSSERNRLETQRTNNAQLRQEVAQLSQFARLRADLEAKQGLLTTLTVNEVRWSVILSDISRVIPTNAWLTSLTGTVQAPAAGSAPQPQATPGARIGSIQVAGCTLLPPDGTHLEVARFLIRIGMPLTLAGPFLTLSSKVGGLCPVQYSANVNLDAGARRANQPGAARRP
jgi:Tfp pilus assembly protein PilN